MSFSAVWRMRARIWSGERDGAGSACGFDEAESWASADRKARKTNRAALACMNIGTGFKPGWFRDVAHPEGFRTRYLRASAMLFPGTRPGTIFRPRGAGA